MPTVALRQNKTTIYGTYSGYITPKESEPVYEVRHNQNCLTLNKKELDELKELLNKIN